jgi:hypothetical protein
MMAKKKATACILGNIAKLANPAVEAANCAHVVLELQQFAWKVAVAAAVPFFASSLKELASQVPVAPRHLVVSTSQHSVSLQVEPEHLVVA